VEKEEKLKAIIKTLLAENKKLKADQDWIHDTMETILYQVDDIMEKIGANVDVRDCRGCGYDQVKKKLNVLKGYLSVKTTVRSLEECVKQFKDACSSSLPVGEVDEEDLRDVFRKCQSVEEIVNKFPEFEVHPKKMECKVCEKKGCFLQ
jgi:vacuolar-type H+-ATPase subunit I/STV1